MRRCYKLPARFLMQLSIFAKAEVKMRISTQMMYDQNMRGITDSQSKWLSYGEQMSTGSVLTVRRTILAASQAVVLSPSQSQNSQFAWRERSPRKSLSGR